MLAEQGCSETAHTKTAALFADPGEYDISEFWSNFSFVKSSSFSFYLVLYQKIEELYTVLVFQKDLILVPVLVLF